MGTAVLSAALVYIFAKLFGAVGAVLSLQSMTFLFVVFKMIPSVPIQVINSFNFAWSRSGYYSAILVLLSELYYKYMMRFLSNII